MLFQIIHMNDTVWIIYRGKRLNRRYLGCLILLTCLTMKGRKVFSLLLRRQLCYFLTLLSLKKSVFIVKINLFEFSTNHPTLFTSLLFDICSAPTNFSFHLFLIQPIDYHVGNQICLYDATKHKISSQWKQDFLSSIYTVFLLPSSIILNLSWIIMLEVILGVFYSNLLPRAGIIPVSASKPPQF